MSGPGASASSASSATVWLAMLAGALTLALTALFPLWTNDLFGHLAAGRQIVALGHVPHHDTFSFYFDHPQPWRNHNWASCVLFYLLYRAGGPDVLVLLKVGMCAIIGALAVASCARRSLAAPISALILLWGTLSVRPRFTMRPHLFGLLCCAILLYALLDLARRDPKRPVWPVVAVLGVLQVLWVNLHGSGPMAFLLSGAFLVGHYGELQRQRWFLALLVVQAVASCVTPFGPAMLLDTFHHVTSEGTRAFIGEWGPLYASDNPWDLPTWFVLSLLALWAAKPLWQSGAEGRSWLLVAAGTLIMAYRSLRFVAEPLLLGAPCIATGLALRLHGVAPRLRQALALSLTLLALATFVRVGRDFPPYQPIGLGLSPRNLPMEPGRWLAAHRPHARSVCLMEDCWYLSFAVPQGLVIMDGRQAVYPLEVLERLSAALTKPEQLSNVLDTKRADAVILRHTRPEHARSIAALRQRSDYGLATVGDRHALFVRELEPEDAIVVLWPNLALRSFSPEQRARAAVELARIGSHPGSSAYVGFQRALLRVSPELRNGGYDGLQPAAAPEQRARYAQALLELAPALVPNENLPTAQVLATMLNLALCRLDRAARSLDLARSEGENRHTLALRIELTTRRGQPQQARSLIDALGKSDSDLWLGVLEQQRSAALREPLCPATPASSAPF